MVSKTKTWQQKSLQVYISQFQILYNFPIMFDAQPRVMSERKISHLIFFLLALIFAILESCSAIIVCGGRWLRYHKFEDIPMWKLYTTGCVGVAGGITTIFHMGAYAVAPLIPNIMQPFWKMQETWQRLKISLSSSTSWTWERILYVALQLIIIVGNFSPLLTSVIVVLIDVDSVGLLSISYQYDTFTLFIFRCFLTSLCIREAYRIFWFVLFFSVTMCRFALDFATTIGRLWNPKMFTDLYTQYFLLYSALSGISEFSVFCCMAATLMVGIILNFLTLRLYSKLPLLFHLTTTVFAVVIPILVNLTLPPIVMSHEETRKLLKMRYLRYRPYRKQNPVLFRVIRAMRPLAFHAGLFDHRFFKLQRSTMFTFYKVYVDYTIVALLYIPV
ncbi:hypothetical protein Fcan01_14380 [Folsomia candida]|uniref:Uncharacterized protein n=1 Tax=Folsomia candida TaxID=158441 RepID=A0A226E123_FOLCA|nr:hypothetical protein Fcan01_14380 [Folsomia candida]